VIDELAEACSDVEDGVAMIHIPLKEPIAKDCPEAELLGVIAGVEAVLVEFTQAQ
jgi:hypothetical protein